MASRSDTDSRLIGVMRSLDKEINTSSSLAVQPSLGDVITWDGRDYQYVMSASELLSKTGAVITPVDNATFNWNKILGSATIASVSLTENMQAAVNAKLEGAGIGASGAISAGWQATFEENKSTILRCGCDGGQAIQNADDFFGAVCAAYKANKGWEHNHWGIVDTVFLSSYRLYSWAKSKQTGFTVALSAKVGASIPIPDTPVQGDVGGDEALAFNVMTTTIDGDLITWPENGDMTCLTKGTLQPFVVGWYMSRLDGDLKTHFRWMP